MKFRNSPTHGAGGYSGLRPRNLTFKKAVKEVMRDRSNNRFMDQMENMFRRIVQEEFGRLIQPYLSSSTSGPIERPCFQTQSSRPELKLRFINSPAASIFTGSKIQAEDGSPVGIELVNAATNARVVSGPFSSSRVEIVPLNADFTEESWTVDGFRRYILKQREGKRPLLTGDSTVTLRNGVGVIEVAFSDNSSWTRSGKFRLGARLTGGGAVEARSQAFGCKDQRGESYQKHHPPYPGDEVWRLEKIGKNGVSARRLKEHGITTVKEFRRLLAIDRNQLYTILTESPGGISKKLWETIESHAMNCVLDETECYLYDLIAHDCSLLFNSVFQVIKVSFNGGPLQNVDQLANSIPDQWKLEAYLNRNSFVQVDGRTFENHPQRSLHCPQDQGFGIACPRLQHMDFQGSSGGPSASSMSHYFTATTAPTVQPEMLMSLENLPTATLHIDGKYLSSLRNSFMVPERDPVHNEFQTVGTRDWNENEEGENTFAHYHHHDAHSHWSPGTQETWDSMFVSVSGTEDAGMYDVRIANINLGSPRARWCKLKAAFKLREVWRHTTARNRGRGKTCNKSRLPY